MADQRVSVRVPDELLDEYDREFGAGEYGSTSRGAKLREAMQLHVEIERLLETLGYTDADQLGDDPKERRRFVRQAILDLQRREDSPGRTDPWNAPDG